MFKLKGQNVAIFIITGNNLHCMNIVNGIKNLCRKSGVKPNFIIYKFDLNKSLDQTCKDLEIITRNSVNFSHCFIDSSYIYNKNIEILNVLRADFKEETISKKVELNTDLNLKIPAFNDLLRNVFIKNKDKFLNTFFILNSKTQAINSDLEFSIKEKFKLTNDVLIVNENIHYTNFVSKFLHN